MGGGREKRERDPAVSTLCKVEKGGGGGGWGGAGGGVRQQTQKDILHLYYHIRSNLCCPMNCTFVQCLCRGQRSGGGMGG